MAFEQAQQLDSLSPKEKIQQITKEKLDLTQELRQLEAIDIGIMMEPELKAMTSSEKKVFKLFGKGKDVDLPESTELGQEVNRIVLRTWKIRKRLREINDELQIAKVETGLKPVSTKPTAPLQPAPTPTSGFEISRDAAEITLARIDNFMELAAENEQEGDETFKRKTRNVWKELVVHGVLGKDKQTGDPMLLNFTDLDGKTCLGLLKLAGIDTKNTKYVFPGESLEGHIHFDTGNKHGLVIEDGGKTAYIDHHADDSGHDSSAAKFTYEVLVKLGLLEKKPHLDKMIEFLTKIDNANYQSKNPEQAFENSAQTVLGLNRFLDFKHLEKFFRDGRDPEEILSKDDLRKMGLDRGNKSQKKIVEISKKRLEHKKDDTGKNLPSAIETQGFVIPTEKYGKIVVDLNKVGGEKTRIVPGGFEAVKAYGYGGYVIWNPETNGFMVTTTEPLQETFPQGKKIREAMWIKPQHDDEPLTITLPDILNKLSDGKFRPHGALKQYLE